jgi:gamma-glutamylcyclotransferase (GGCT)/AIG2-like uncharacterized protein YtfP
LAGTGFFVGYATLREQAVDWYFAYGSNLDTTQMAQRCPGAVVVGPGRLAGYRLGFTSYSPMWDGGVADVMPTPDAEVWGLLYQVTPADLRRLDEYEGYPRVYTRHRVSVETPSGESIETWTYAVVHKRRLVRPSPGYIAILLDAAQRWGFPESYQAFLRAIPIKSNTRTQPQPPRTAHARS